MSIAQIVVMIIAGIGAFIGMSKQKEGKTWGQPLAIVCAIVAIVAALWSAIGTMSGAPGKQAGEREIEFQKVQTRVLGAHLAEKYSGAKAIVIKDPFNTDATRPNPLLDGLKEGMGSAIQIVAEVFPPLPAGYNEGGEGEMMAPMETWYTAKVMQDILKNANADYDMVITCIGLPAGGLLHLKGKKVVFAGGSPYEYAAAIAGGLVVAAVTYKPDAIYDDKPVPSNLQEAFDKRYVLISTDNIKEVASKYAELFKQN
ncbi:hypothetical protein [Oligosphaera ethanolica]|uniref:Uncharacterized protein n=1 Tax=Oligosphaera ethanolica TaxID=760260 RepID=A0AAE3VEH2_9BACT|nr:hypothetical protein [Oligosphaera ethanolica]MDQ0289008.1 hypothetical protein [Oligosphaera ethanolica]HQL88806.1 hypothetical protein [Lentisphaeria bacterium]